jgi:hypothetical protein
LAWISTDGGAEDGASIAILDGSLFMFQCFRAAHH